MAITHEYNRYDGNCHTATGPATVLNTPGWLCEQILSKAAGCCVLHLFEIENNKITDWRNCVWCVHIQIY